MPTVLALVLAGIVACAAQPVTQEEVLRFAGNRNHYPGPPSLYVEVFVVTRSQVETSLSSRGEGEQLAGFGVGGNHWYAGFFVRVGDPVPLGARVYRVTGFEKDVAYQRAMEEERREAERARKEHPDRPVPIRDPSGQPRDVIHLRLERSPRATLSERSIVLPIRPGNLSFFPASNDDRPHQPAGNPHLQVRVLLDGVRLAKGTDEAVATVLWQFGPLNSWWAGQVNPKLPIHQVEVKKGSVIALPQIGRLKVVALVPAVPDQPAWVVLELVGEGDGAR